MKRSLIICFLVIGLSLGSMNNTQGKSPGLNTTDWKTYTNKNYGYQINYPQECEQFEWRGRGEMEVGFRGSSTSRPDLLGSFDVFISIDNNLNMLSLKCWAEEMKPYFGKENQISIYEKMVKVGDEKGPFTGGTGTRDQNGR